MANQIVVSAGAKVRNLDGVLTGTSGVVNSLPINASNGIPQLDVNGKILVSQLPNSVMEYQGVWNANTNTPTLVNGTGNQGDVYLCNVAGTVDFGAGPIAFVVGDQVIYSGSIWQRASGATGTVTSVAITESGDSLNITGSPITTSGTINIGFNGTNLQYVNGAGNLTTFPTLITSIGLSMPSAFSVSNSPLTANGTIAVTGAGYASQYIRGDGTLADFPSSGGGGSSVSYYLNGGTSQGTIGGTTYYEMSKTADTGTGVDFAKSGDGFIVAFLTDANDPAQLNIPAGNWNYEIYASMSANGGTPQMYAELYKYDGTTFTLISTSTNEILYDGTNLNLYTFGMTVPATTLTLTDRLAIKLYATNSGGKTTTVHTQDSHLCQVITTFSTGITALNGLTAQVQYFQVGTSGTDFNISSTTATHTFNIPSASATNRGLITTGSQTIAGSKTFNATLYGTDSEFSGSVLSPIFSVLNGTKVVNLQSLATLNRDIYLPDASGTVALLEGTQTFTGGKTFTGSATFNNTLGNSIILNYGAALVKGNTPSSTSGVWSNIYAAAGNNNFVIADNANISKLQFQAASSYTYTFPAATGTLALTTDIPSITGLVPYTGATGAVNLGNYELTSSNLIAGGTSGNAGMLHLKSDVVLTSKGNGYTSIGAYAGSGIIQFQMYTGAATYKSFTFSIGGLTDNTNRQFTLPNASGTVALTSDIPSLTGYVTGTGTTNYLPKFTGTSTIGNSLIQDDGTTVQINAISKIWDGTQGLFIRAYTSGAGFGAIYSTGVTPAAGNFALAASATQTILSGVDNISLAINSAIKLYVNSSGNVGIGTTSPNYVTSGRTVLDVNGTSTALIALSVGGTPKSYFYFDGTDTQLYSSAVLGLYAGGSERLRITSGGNVLIGTTTDSGALLNMNFTSSGNVALNINRTSSGAGYFYNFAIAGSQKQYSYYNGSTVEFGVIGTITASAFYESSDSRLKTLIQDNYQTKGIASITPKLYIKNGKVELGYYAQDFVGILDSAISKGSDDMLSLSYREVHTAKIYALEQEIKELKAKLN